MIDLGKKFMYHQPVWEISIKEDIKVDGSQNLKDLKGKIVRLGVIMDNMENGELLRQSEALRLI